MKAATVPARSRVSFAIAAVAVVAAAFVPRVVALDRGFMIDEKLWIGRSDRFVTAVAEARFGDAFTTGHPGVTTSWIGGVAQRSLPQTASLTDRYERARLAMAIVNALLILLIWLLARPLLGEAAAAAGGLLLALDPFLLAHTRVLHMDGLQALTMIASFVALLRASREDDRRLFVGSAVLAGLAFLTKETSALLGVAAWWIFAADGRELRRRLLRWAGIAAGVIVALWPLVWVRPWKAVWLLAWSAGRAAGDDSDAGAFFLGGSVPLFPLFYGVAFALRSSIATLPGVIAAGVWSWRRRAADADARLAWRLVVAGLTWTAFLTIATKKADRYLLPAMAAWDLALAIGLVRLIRNRRPRLLAPALAVVLALHAGPALAIHPWELASYNWAAGGPPAARWALPVGRAEGLDVAAKDLNRLPGAENLTVATTRLTQFADFFDGRTIRIEDSALGRPGGEPADLVLFYVSSVQAGRGADALARFEGRPPLYELEINGISYVRVWRVSG